MLQNTKGILTLASPFQREAALERFFGPSRSSREAMDDAPFNRALEGAKHGMTMVLDQDAQPFKRIWCLFEVQRRLNGRA